MRTECLLMTVKNLLNLIDGAILNDRVQHPELWLQKFIHRL